AHLDRFGQRRRLADQKIGAGQLIGRLELQEGAVLADPGLLHAEAVGHEDLVEILVVAQLGDLVAAVAVRKNADLHPRALARGGWSAAARTLSRRPASARPHCHFGRRLYKSPQWAFKKSGWVRPRAISRLRGLTASSRSI